MFDRTYLCIDLKSFFASVECVERGLDPMTTNLVVADPERTDKTICLAITPAMKKLGIRNRCRVFEIPSYVDYIMVPPRMRLYLEYSADIYAIYLRYISPADIHVYSVDECFMDVTRYLALYNMNGRELGIRIMNDIFKETGIRATCGIGSNLYLTKIALDITAKHSADFIGVLDEDTYKATLWDHRPLTDFWRVGPGTARRLEGMGIYTMRDIANTEPEYLYNALGIDAELLIDHARGIEPVTIKDIKSYKASSHSITSGQVLMCDYSFNDGLIVVKEMADSMCLDLVDKKHVTDSITLHAGYSNALKEKPAHGTISLDTGTSADSVILPAIESLYRRIVNPHFHVRRFNISFNNIVPEEYRQYSIFDDIEELERNHTIQQTVLDIRKRFGKNAILKGMNLQKNATARERNMQIGGHKSGDFSQNARK